VITEEGRAALTTYATRIDMKALEAYPAYLEFRDRTRKETPAAVEAVASTVEATPSDLIEQAVSTNRAAVEGEVLKSALALSPTGFEDLVIRLLERMGYGRAGSIDAPAPPGMPASTASSARTRSGWTASTCRPSGMPRTEPSTGPASMSSPVRC
jgi:restriction system protein